MEVIRADYRAASTKDAATRGVQFTVRVNRDILFDAPYQPIQANPLLFQPPGQLHRRSCFSGTPLQPGPLGKIEGEGSEFRNHARRSRID
jgi:hypothetical protein